MKYISITSANFPARFNVDDLVSLQFYDLGKLNRDCKVVAVKFTDYGKVLYDIEVPIVDGEDKTTIPVVLNNVPSDFVDLPKGVVS